MRDVALFVEDYTHRQVIGALVNRVAHNCGIQLRLDWRNARHGYGAVVQELSVYLRDFKRQAGPLPDLIIVGPRSRRNRTLTPEAWSSAWLGRRQGIEIEAKRLRPSALLLNAGHSRLGRGPLFCFAIAG
jgi:hypothetical protein